jgi:hypothetical protein
MPTLANRHRIHLRHSAEQPSRLIHTHQDAFAAELPMQHPAERHVKAVRGFIPARYMQSGAGRRLGQRRDPRSRMNWGGRKC